MLSSKWSFSFVKDSNLLIKNPTATPAKIEIPITTNIELNYFQKPPSSKIGLNIAARIPDSNPVTPCKLITLDP